MLKLNNKVVKDKTTLHLNLCKKWFDMYLSGQKTEEYREIKEHWIPQLMELKHPFSPGGCFETDSVRSAYNYSRGASKTRADAIKYLLERGGSFKEFETITFSNGMKTNGPRFVIEWKGIHVGKAVPEWSDNWQGDLFVTKVGNIISTHNI